MKTLFCAVTFLIFGFASLALATTSSCITGEGTLASPILCNLYENAADYPLTYATTAQTPGYVVLMESGNPSSLTDMMNQSLWSDVLQFDANALHGSGSTTLELLFNPLTFPSYSTVTSGPNAFILESQIAPYKTVWDPNNDGTAIFNVYSPPPPAIPEPSGYAFLVSGLVVVAAVVRRRRATAVPEI